MFFNEGALTFSLYAWSASITTTTVVTPAPSNPTNNSNAPKPMSDADQKIVSAIYAKYAKSAALTGTGLTIISDQGIVTINGRVTAQSQADEAVALAKSIVGVKDVRSQITVITNPPAALFPNLLTIKLNCSIIDYCFFV